MTELELKQLLSKITRPDETARTAAHAHWASLAKPLGGLGRLETQGRLECTVRRKENRTNSPAHRWHQLLQKRL